MGRERRGGAEEGDEEWKGERKGRGKEMRNGKERERRSDDHVHFAKFFVTLCEGFL